MEAIEVVPRVQLRHAGHSWRLTGLVDANLGVHLLLDPLGDDPGGILDEVDRLQQLGITTAAEQNLLGASDAWLESVEGVVIKLAEQVTEPVLMSCYEAGWQRRCGNPALWLYARAARLAA